MTTETQEERIKNLEKDIADLTRDVANLATKAVESGHPALMSAGLKVLTTIKIKTTDDQKKGELTL